MTNAVTVRGGRSHSLELLPHRQVGGERGKDTAEPVYDFHEAVQTLPARRVEAGAKGGEHAKEMLSSLPPLQLMVS